LHVGGLHALVVRQRSVPGCGKSTLCQALGIRIVDLTSAMIAKAYRAFTIIGG